MDISRRRAMATMAALTGACVCGALAADETKGWRLAHFEADVTPPVGHPLLGNHFKPSQSIADPLSARGLVLLGGGQPIVLTVVDWCELRNDAYANWRKALAEAAGTTAERVIVSCVHQHDAPYFDLTAQKLLAESPQGGKMCDIEFHERAVAATAAALKQSLGSARPVTRLGAGQAKVEQVASNRRVVGADQRVSFKRLSRTYDTAARNSPEGLIDPWLKTISFWNEEEPLAALSSYACHPMSYYGSGEISGDFVNMARRQREQDAPRAFQIYASGCCGDVTAGKYNNGARANRPVLADRLYRGMSQAWQAMTFKPLKRVECRSTELLLPHSELPEMSAERLRAVVASEANLYTRAEAAMGLSSLARNPQAHAIDLQVIDFGGAKIVLLPAESFVAYQLLAQSLRPDDFVMCLGFGESAPGYIPTDDAFREGYRQEHHYCWVAPGAEARIAAALKKALNP